MTDIIHQMRRLHGGWLNGLPAIALLVGFIFTGLLVNSAYQVLKKDRLAELDVRASALVDGVEEIISNQHYLLLSLRSLFDGSTDVSRLDFKRYLDSINLPESFPSVYAVGWYLRVPHHKLAAYEQLVREDRSVDSGGYPDFKVFPEMDAAEHHVLTYRYPVSKDRTLFGFDLGSSHQRLLALEHARDSASFNGTAPLTLLDGSIEGQGFLLMLPVYSVSNPSSLQQRRQSYLGMLSGVFKVGVLMSDSMQNDFTAIAIRDITNAGVDGRASASASATASATAGPEGSTTEIDPFYRTGVASDSSTTVFRTTRIGDRQWEFAVSMDALAMQLLKDNTLCWVIGVLGTVVTLLVSLGAASLTTARNRAVRLAESLGTDLLELVRDREQSSNDLSQFAYVASHDLKTPVRDVDMSVTLLEDALTNRMDPQVREYLNNLRASAGRMRALVDGLHDFAQVERETLQWAELDLNAIIATVEQERAAELQEAEGTVTTGELPILKGDQKQLEKLFGNLLSNAIRFRHTGRALRLNINARLVGTDWEVRFSDNGVGIDRRFHEKVFEPFQRLHGSVDSQGSGLGLGICRQIVECHDGELYIESSSEAGTTLVIRLPVREQRLDQAA